MVWNGHEVHPPPEYAAFLQSQSHIGWRHMMEGMISRELLLIHQQDILLPWCRLSVLGWVQTLIRKLIEATHGVWIYRNLTIHDKISGLVATKGKEQLLQAIEQQIELGGENLGEDDKWMLEINSEELETSSGERECYWLIAIQSARARFSLRR